MFAWRMDHRLARRCRPAVVARGMVSPALAAAVLLTGCGASPHRQPQPRLGRWLSTAVARRTATVSLVAAADDAFGGFNFNGRSKGAVLVTVPLGWKVVVRCANARGSARRHSCAVVRGPLSVDAAFPGAASPDPRTGLAAGGTTTFSFVASRRGSYRLACLVPGHERAGMWDVLDVTSASVPSVRLLRA